MYKKNHAQERVSFFSMQPEWNSGGSGVAKELVADWQTLTRTFIRTDNEATRATLVRYMEKILFGLHDFLKQHVGVTEEISLKELSDRFTDTDISMRPERRLAEVIQGIVLDIAPHAVNVASPYFIGHMTSAIPFFMVHLRTIVTALNQNANKLETSKVVSVIEKQVVAKMHRLIFNRDVSFYDTHVQSANSSLGTFTDGGTSANMTALWAARNAALGPTGDFKGVELEGLPAAYRAHGVDRCVVLVSRRGHFSLRKAGGLLGIGNDNIIPVDVDEHNRIDLDVLEKMVLDFQNQGRTKIIAIVGVAGATETGTIDPLNDLADLCEKYGLYFHADAAWGGPTLMSQRYQHLLDGIHRADSVTVDGHKQLYMPMGCGMIFFKDPSFMDRIAYHAYYVNREGSADLGIKTIAGSREANSLILDSALKIMGRQGYALLIDHGIDLAKAFADEINRRPMFQLVTEPVLNILTYRLVPPEIQSQMVCAGPDEQVELNQILNELNRVLQRIQREAGKSFVSRTVLNRYAEAGKEVAVLRVVLMNPLTNMEILREILDEQEAIYLEQVAPKLKP